MFLFKILNIFAAKKLPKAEGNNGNVHGRKINENEPNQQMNNCCK